MVFQPNAIKMRVISVTLMMTLVASLQLALQACARPGKSSDEGQNGQDAKVFLGMSVPDQSALPPCDQNQANRIVYVVAEKGFRMCEKDRTDGEWSVVVIGPQPSQPPPAAPPNAEETYQKAFALYGKYRASVMRISLTCKNGENASTSQGTAFMCASKTLCTNRHVLSCPESFSPDRLLIHRVADERDSIVTSSSNGELPPPVLMVSGIAIKEWIKEHPSRDLAKVQAPASSESPAVGEIPDAPVLPVATSPFTETAKTLSWVMTMGFPLGFTELYTDLGRVNSNTLSSCQATDNECLRTQLDFSTTNDTDRGSSGSPLMDLDGRVIGVVSAGTNGQNVNFTYAIDASLVSGF